MIEQFGSIRVWLAASICLMSLALLISTSRSGLIGLGVGALGCAALAGASRAPAARRWLLFQGIMLALVALSFGNVGALSARMDETLAETQSDGGRTGIWRDSARMMSDFPLSGTGAGTFGLAIAPYQTTARGYALGQAHNHYVQLASEGGALLALPAAAALLTFVLLARRRLLGARGPILFIRGGALAGLAAVLMQSVWETGLRMPANAALCAMLAAIAVHDAGSCEEAR